MLIAVVASACLKRFSKGSTAYLRDDDVFSIKKKNKLFVLIRQSKNLRRFIRFLLINKHTDRNHEGGYVEKASY